MKKISLISLLVVLAIGGVWSYRAHTAATPKNGPVPGDRFLARAEKRDIDFSIEISGDVTPVAVLDVKPEVGGRIKELHVEPGQMVKEGDVLVEIDDTDLLTEKESVLTEIDGAKLSVDKTQKNFDRGKELFAARLISREAFDNLESDYSLAQNGLVKAQRKLQITEDKLSKTKVLAPSEGTVLTVPVTDGQVVIAAASVNNGTTLMTIADLTKLLVDTQINQVDVARLELNKRVKLRVESLKDVQMEARIWRIAPIATVKNAVKGFEVQALIDAPNPRLRPGMTVNMTVPIARAEDAVSVPISAIFKGEGNSKVVYVRAGESSQRRQVKIGISNFDYAQILNGITEGEEILLIEPDRNGQKKS
jgi:RND family efflux transporter MFP subunit